MPTARAAAKDKLRIIEIASWVLWGSKDVCEISALSDKVDIGREIARDFEADVLLAYCGSGPDFHGVSSILCGSVIVLPMEFI
jgi:hypothetical protein